MTWNFGIPVLSPGAVDLLAQRFAVSSVYGEPIDDQIRELIQTAAGAQKACRLALAALRGNSHEANWAAVDALSAVLGIEGEPHRETADRAARERADG